MRTGKEDTRREGIGDREEKEWETGEEALQGRESRREKGGEAKRGRGKGHPLFLILIIMKEVIKGT